MARLDNRAALITGASRGIGRAAALKLADEGAHVIATARSKAALEELDDEVTAAGGEITLVQMDLADRPAMLRLAEAIAGRWGRLDVMIANAGVLGDLTPVAHLDADTWDQVIDTNLSAIWRMIRAFDPLLRQSPSGRAVLMTSSAASNDDLPFWSAYAASKAGLEALGKSWAAETRQTALKINILDPGATATAMFSQAFPGADLNAMRQPMDIVEAFVALAAEDCPWHGQVLRADQLI